MFANYLNIDVDQTSCNVIFVDNIRVICRTVQLKMYINPFTMIYIYIIMHYNYDKSMTYMSLPSWKG